MPNTRLANSVFFMLVVLGAAQFFYYAPRLPDIMGSHFSGAGVVNGWQAKTAFFTMELAIIVLATAVSFGVPRIIAAMPVALINLPHKEFWFAPERLDGTLAYIRRWSAWFGCALLAFLVFVMELAIRANLHIPPPQFNNAVFVPALLAFVALDTIGIVRLVLHFSKPDE
jgi:uncharacterized membrane protein